MFGTYRTFLALLVVLQHLGGIPVVGGYAVFGFYILSGYLMTLIMQTGYGYTRSGVAKYALNRFLRIYPMYWLSAIASLLLVLRLGSDYTSSFHAAIRLPTDISGILRNVFLYFPDRAGVRLTPPSWALTVEIFYYIAIGLGLSKNPRVVVGWFLLSLGYHLIAFVLNLNWQHRYFAVYAASLPFATGALIFHYRDSSVKYLRLHLGEFWHLLPYCILVCGILNWILGYLTGNLKGLFFYTNYLLCSLMVLALAARREIPMISRRLDKFMGDLSYPIYLVHYQVGLFIVASGLVPEKPSLALVLVSLPVILLLAWGMAVSLERPIDVIRRRVKA